MLHYADAKPVNIGTGQDLSIRDLALLIREVTGYQGTLRFDPSKPDGTPRKLLDVSKMHAMGWVHSIALRKGIEEVYHNDFLLRCVAEKAVV